MGYLFNDTILLFACILRSQLLEVNYAVYEMVKMETHFNEIINDIFRCKFFLIWSLLYDYTKDLFLNKRLKNKTEFQ
jgi:hypothetical protein